MGKVKAAQTSAKQLLQSWFVPVQAVRVPFNIGGDQQFSTDLRAAFLSSPWLEGAAFKSAQELQNCSQLTLVSGGGGLGHGTDPCQVAPWDI